MGFSDYINLQKKQFSQIPKKVSELFTFDVIHFEKILEISQYSILGFFLSLVLGNAVNNMMDNTSYRLGTMSTTEMILQISLYTIILTIAVKYIPKVVSLIPFLGWWDSHYIPNGHLEAMFSIRTAIGWSIYTQISNYNNMIKELSSRLFSTGRY